MANLCENIFEVRGNPAEVDEIVAIVTKWAASDGNTVYHIKTQFSEPDWGETSEGAPLGAARLSFTTNNYPETERISKLAAEHPKCTFNLYYCESGREFQGFIAFKDGKQVGGAVGPYFGVSRS